MQFFREYLQYGYYPYYLQLKDTVDYYSTIENTVSYIIDDELPRICRVDVANTRKIKALVNIGTVRETFAVNQLAQAHLVE